MKSLTEEGVIEVGDVGFKPNYNLYLRMHRYSHRGKRVSLMPVLLSKLKYIYYAPLPALIYNRRC